MWLMLPNVEGVGQVEVRVTVTMSIRVSAGKCEHIGAVMVGILVCSNSLGGMVLIPARRTTFRQDWKC